jgi:ABC-2 type transport system ATP-binding protein
MSHAPPAIEIRNLTHAYGKAEAVRGLSLTVRPGTCYGFFGRNGAGKTTSIKCLLNLLRPTSGSVRIFGMDPQREEVAVKASLAYVPDHVAFYPWMTVGATLAYLASFRGHWNGHTEKEMLAQFRLDPAKKVSALSKGQTIQLALIAAICPDPALLILDEPTSGLDPVIRREFIQTIIGAYQDADPGNRTIFLSTHLIAEAEGLIDDFTIIDQGRSVLTEAVDVARNGFRRILARFAGEVPALTFPNIFGSRREARELELIVQGDAEPVLARLRSFAPEDITTEGLTLEEIFLVCSQRAEGTR